MDVQTEDVPLAAPLVGIVYNLKKGLEPSAPIPDLEAEYDSMDTVLSIEAALKRRGLNTVLMEADAQLAQKLREQRPAIVFNIAEGSGGRGREAQVPALLSLLDIPYTGSDETAMCLSLDKALAKRLLSTYRVRTPRYTVIEPGAAIHAAGMRYPVLVKPNAEGSSKGISEACIAENRAQLVALAQQNAALYGQPMLAEEYIGGREFTVGLLGNGTSARAFRPMEVAYLSNTQGGYRVYSYRVKQDYQRYIRYICPADVPPKLEAHMQSEALKIYRALGCRDLARVDFRLDEAEKLYFIEINPLPGLAPGYSDYPMLCEKCGLPYDELILKILQTGAARYGIRL